MQLNDRTVQENTFVCNQIKYTAEYSVAIGRYSVVKTAHISVSQQVELPVRPQVNPWPKRPFIRDQSPKHTEISSICFSRRWWPCNCTLMVRSSPPNYPLYTLRTDSFCWGRSFPIPCVCQRELRSLVDGPGVAVKQLSYQISCYYVMPIIHRLLPVGCHCSEDRERQVGGQCSSEDCNKMFFIRL